MPNTHPQRLQWLIPLLALACVTVALCGASAEALWTLRLPRVVCGFVVGALLALSGLSMQVLLRNPLADPYVLGTSAGAATGAIAALLCGVAIAWGAAAGAILSSLALLWLARHALKATNEGSSVHLVLMGAMLAATLGAVATLLLTLTPDQQLRGAVFWLVGDLSGNDGFSPLLWTGAALVAIFLLILFAKARSVDRLMLGTQVAWQLGEDVSRLRWLLLLISSLAVACAVALSGAIGFVGLVIPQLLRVGGVFATRQLAWLSALAGGALLVLADTAAWRIASPIELPVGAIMALIGAPILVWFLSRHAVHEG